MKYELSVTARMEDGSERTVLYGATEEHALMLRRVACVLGKQEQYNWCPSQDLCSGIEPSDYVKKKLLSKKDVTAFEGFVPHGGNYWCVNIEEMTLSPVVEKEILLGSK